MDFTKEDIRRLEAFEMWIWRRMMKVSWTEHKTNEEVLQMVDIERQMMDTLRRRQRWLGHVIRYDSLLRITLEGRIEGKQERWISPTERASVSAISLRHILASPGYAPGTIAVNVTWMK